MRVVSELEGWTPSRVREALAGLPWTHGYTVVVKPLNWRRKPSLQGLCHFVDRRIVIQVPVPFRPFTEKVYYRAKRLPGQQLRFRWYHKMVLFRSRRDVIRFIYLHEFLHWYMWEVLKLQAGAETACDRFALENFRKLGKVKAPERLVVRSAPRYAGSAARGR